MQAFSPSFWIGALALTVVAAAHAQPSDITVSQAWTRVVGATALTAAGYMTLHNRDAFPDHLIGAETSVARAVEVHEQREQQGWPKPP